MEDKIIEKLKDYFQDLSKTHTFSSSKSAKPKKRFGKRRKKSYDK